jgi:alkylation response protein AidB-like acyl-CoA dehydrogenase
VNGQGLLERLRLVVANKEMPLPGGGKTALRHKLLMEIGREDLSLARLAEAHWDAIAILSEAGRKPATGAIYGVWASQKRGEGLTLNDENGRLAIEGSKRFCSGAGMVDRALLTVSEPEQLLIDIDLSKATDAVEFDVSEWKATAFRQTRTATTTFKGLPVSEMQVIGAPGWYLARPGFWHGACGPAACWAGGAEGLVDYAIRQAGEDHHALAHLGAMRASIWSLCSCLDSAGREIDEEPSDPIKARMRALMVRHLVEQACTDVLRRLPRAYGPHPFAFNEGISRRYQELDLYLRQSHAERDLELLGIDVRDQARIISRDQH